MTLTKGQYRVGIGFNPSGTTIVDQIKAQAAALIDLIESIPSDRETEDGNERGRLKALAQTEAESAAMWAVKAATKGIAPAPGGYGLPNTPLADPFMQAVERAMNWCDTVYGAGADREDVRKRLGDLGFPNANADDVADMIEAIRTTRKPGAA